MFYWQLHTSYTYCSDNLYLARTAIVNEGHAMDRSFVSSCIDTFPTPRTHTCQVRNDRVMLRRWSSSIMLYHSQFARKSLSMQTK
jgi:hypothetical protein